MARSICSWNTDLTMHFQLQNLQFVFKPIKPAIVNYLNPGKILYEMQIKLILGQILISKTNLHAALVSG